MRDMWYAMASQVFGALIIAVIPTRAISSPARERRNQSRVSKEAVAGSEPGSSLTGRLARIFAAEANEATARSSQASASAGRVISLGTLSISVLSATNTPQHIAAPKAALRQPSPRRRKMRNSPAYAMKGRSERAFRAMLIAKVASHSYLRQHPEHSLDLAPPVCGIRTAWCAERRPE